MDQLNDISTEEMTPEMGDMLPDEIRQMLEIAKEKKAQQIDALGESIAKKRDDAINWRKQSGIEEEWIEDEEAYQGVDDANRGEAKAYKPDSPQGSALFPRRDPSRSTVFLNITRPYVDAASARVGDMMLPTDDRNWAIKPTPIPELASQKDSPEGVNNAMGQPIQNTDTGKQLTVGDMVAEAMAKANKSAEAAQTQIDDWLVESQWHAEVRKMIENCSRIGSGVLKGPTPVKRKYKAAVQENGQMALVMKMKIAPESKSIDPWNLYPAPDCGDNIHNGSYILERDDINARQLRDLKGTPGYIDSQIEKVLDEGPDKKYANDISARPGLKSSQLNDDRYRIWYYYGILDREDLEAMGVDLEDTTLDGVPAIVTMVNDSPIKAVLNPLDSGEYPYDLMPWQRRTNMPWGMGVARQMRTPQRMLNAATRNLMDNAGISAGPQIVIWKNKLVPADGQWSLSPRKIWYAKEDADIKGVSDAFASFAIDSRQAELSNIIQFALKMAEDVTGLPQLLQGMQGQAPDTVGGMQMLQNNASTVLRRIARTFDDYVTEPHIRRYYDWLMMYGEDEACKGDFVIDARGSTALVERDLQNQAIMGMGPMTKDPAFKLSPSKWIKEALKSQRLDPKRFEMDEEEMQQLAQQPPPEAPQVAAAKIRAETDLKKTQMVVGQKDKEAQIDNQTDQLRIKRDIDRDTVYVQAEQQRTVAEQQGQMAELALRRELAMMEYANKNQMQLNEVKAQLAETTMKLQTQKELAGASIGADLHKHKNPTPQVASPAIEPPGRAPDGEAFQR